MWIQKFIIKLFSTIRCPYLTPTNTFIFSEEVEWINCEYSFRKWLFLTPNQIGHRMVVWIESWNLHQTPHRKRVVNWNCSSSDSIELFSLNVSSRDILFSDMLSVNILYVVILFVNILSVDNLYVDILYIDIFFMKFFSLDIFP